VRDMILGRTVKASSSLTGFNIDVPQALIAKDPAVAPFLVETNYWIGNSQVAALIPMPDPNDMINLNLVVETGGGGGEEGNGTLQQTSGKSAPNSATSNPGFRNCSISLKHSTLTYGLSQTYRL